MGMEIPASKRGLYKMNELNSAILDLLQSLEVAVKIPQIAPRMS
jgi:hypothetical protein